MKFQSVVMVSGLSVWMWAAAASPDDASSSGLKAPAKSLEALFRDLADDKFRTRENASREIWKIGEPALAALQEIAAGKDPEQAYRARELIQKIQLQITPDTDPAVTALVERYAKASPNEKVVLFDQLHKRRAWRQILKLYAAETDPDLQARLERSVEGVAVTAARECLLKGNAEGARDFLEMAPADAPGLLALADFHRSQGTLVAELKRAQMLKGAHSDAWQLALHRAAGNLESAREAATAAGEFKIAASLSALLGDPLPWLRENELGVDGEAVHKPYTAIAIKRWQGKMIQPADLKPLVRGLSSDNPGERQSSINSLFLLGEAKLAEEAYRKGSPLEAFTYFESLERIPDALQSLGLDPEKPDYAAWVEKRITHLSHEDVEDEHGGAMEIPELVALGNFLERRGLNQQCSVAFLKPLATMAEKDAKKFTEFLGAMFGNNTGNSGEPQGAPRIANQAAIAWAGENADRWVEVINAAFGGQDEILGLWDWMAELDPKTSRMARLDGMLALCGLGRDPLKLRDHWLGLAWGAVDKADPGNRKALLEKLAFLSSQTGDAANSLKVWDQLPESSRKEISWRGHILDLSASGRWAEAATFFLSQIERVSQLKQSPQPSLYACAAASLRKAGRVAEAAAQDAWVEKLALGNDAVEIANGYAYGYDFKKAAEWWARGARQSSPGSEELAAALQLHAEMEFQNGNWKEVAALSEVMAQMAASVGSGSGSPLVRLRLRLQSDLGRALANLKADRAGSVAILANCHQMFPSDGSLADDFFPAIRKMGLIKEHDEWFQISWDRMSAVIAQFPDSDNTQNTAAWLASRAQRNLDQAQQYLEKALAMNPNQSAYLDTMAEIQFAKGNRNLALEWSSRAVNFMPLDVMLRRQHERFRAGPIPR